MHFDGVLSLSSADAFCGSVERVQAYVAIASAGTFCAKKLCRELKF